MLDKKEKDPGLKSIKSSAAPMLNPMSHMFPVEDEEEEEEKKEEEKEEP